MNRCKVCALSSSEKGEAEKRLRTKRSHAAIAAELMGIGIDVIPGDLTKHYNCHMDKEHARDMCHPNMMNVMEFNQKLEELKKEALERDYTQEVINSYKDLHVLLNQAITINGVMLTEQMYQCAKKQASYPTEEARGLKTLVEIRNSLPMYTDPTLRGVFVEISEASKAKNS